MNTIQRRTFLGSILALPLVSPLRLFARDIPASEVTVKFGDDSRNTLTLRGYSDGRIEGTYFCQPMKALEQEGDWTRLLVQHSKSGSHVFVKGKYVARANNFAIDGVSFLHRNEG